MMKAILPPRLFLVAIILMVLLNHVAPIGRVLDLPVKLIGLLPLLFGLGLSITGKRQFTTAQTNINTFEKPTKLVTDGLFRYSRNPMYLGFSVALIGFSLTLGSVSPFFICLIFIVITDRWYIAYEEKIMLEEFGERYKAYRHKTRRWL